MAFSGKLMAAGTNAKTIKGDGTKYETAITYMAAADDLGPWAEYFEQGMRTVCPLAVLGGCSQACLVNAGRGRMSSVVESRVRKKLFYLGARSLWLQDMVADLERFVRKCEREGVEPCYRPNGTSDIEYERGHPVVRDGVEYPSIMDAFPTVQFYDYTKIYARMYKTRPANYHLTLSYSEANPVYAKMCIQAQRDTGCNLAVVFRTKRMADTVGTFLDLPVIDGNESDLRFTDPNGCIVGLYARGGAKHDDTGFVIDV